MTNKYNILVNEHQVRLLKKYLTNPQSITATADLQEILVLSWLFDTDELKEDSVNDFANEAMAGLEYKG